jgi:uncharacterized membrane protein HdeD (DUF308 family)
MDDVARVAKHWWVLALLGVISIVAGVLAIAYPDITLLAMGIIFGVYLLIAGAFEIVQAISGDEQSRALSAILGVVGLIAGLVCVRRPGESVLALVLVLGAYLIVRGAVHLVIALGYAEHRGLGLLAAAADIVLGIVILALPKESVVTLAVLFGISLIIRGTAACVAAFLSRRLQHAGADVAGSAGVGAAA